MELFVNLPMAGIDTAVTDHFIMLFRDVPDKTLYEFHNRDGFFHLLLIFVSVVMESDKVAVTFINPGCSDDGTFKIAANVFDGCFGATFAGFGIYIETFLVFPVAAGLDFFKGGANHSCHFIEQGSAEGVAQECIVKVIDAAPKCIVAVSAFRNKTVDMGVPF